MELKLELKAFVMHQRFEYRSILNYIFIQSYIISRHKPVQFPSESVETTSFKGSVHY